MLVIWNRKIVFCFSADLEKRLVFSQTELDDLSLIRSFQDLHGNSDAVRLILNLFDDVLVAAHFNDHADCDLFVLANLDESASAALSVL
jgi:hypothetical protein